MLLAEGADPNVCRIDGASPLWIAAQMGHDHIVRLLLKSGARIDAVRCVRVLSPFQPRYNHTLPKQEVITMNSCKFSGRRNAIVQSSSQRILSRCQ